MTTTEVNTKFDSFVAKYLKLGRVDTDGVPEGKVYQCVDLIKRYAHEVYGIPYGSYGDAVDYWHYTAPILLTKFTKLGTTSVKKGDIVILKPVDSLPRHKAGHITLATGKQTSTTYQAVEQNGYNGSGDGLGGNAIRYRDIAKGRIFGVLRPKTSVPAPTFKMPKIGSSIQLIPQDTRTTYHKGTSVVAGHIRVTDNSFIYEVRGYDKNRIIINTKSGGGNGVALALYYTNGSKINGWKEL